MPDLGPRSASSRTASRSAPSSRPDGDAAAAAGRRSLRPLGDPNRRAIVDSSGPASDPCRDRRRAADQPAGRLAAPAPPEARGTRRREAIGHATDLSASRPGYRGRTDVPRTGLGRRRGTISTCRREHRRGPTKAMIEPILLAFDVDCPVDRAFDIWTARIAQWWPRDHTVSAEADLMIVLEGRPAAASLSVEPVVSSTIGVRSRSGSRPRASATPGTSTAIAPMRPTSKSGSFDAEPPPRGSRSSTPAGSGWEPPVRTGATGTRVAGRRAAAYVAAAGRDRLAEGD